MMLTFKLLFRATLETPQTVLAIAIAFGCLPELDGKALLLKTAHTFVTGNREMRPAVAGNLPHWTPALEGALCIAAGRKYINKFTQLRTLYY